MNEPRDHWLTKTDFIHFCLCPYAHSMYQAGLIAQSGEEREETESGDFPRDVSELFKRRRWRLITDKNAVFRNTALKIAGRPDGIDRAGGAMIPIDVMTRIPSFGEDGEIEYRPPEIRWLHRWGLAFYWLVLSPQRTRHEVPPLGRVVFEIGEVGHDRLESRDLPLADDLVGVEFAIEKARQAKTSLSPHSCGRCDVCKTRFVHRLQLATEQRSLALVTPIPFLHALDLERAGIGTVEDLVRAAPHAISRAARVSEKRAAAWKRAASAAATGAAVVLRRPEVLPDPANMVVLDTEHGRWRISPWLIGIRVVRHGESADHILWAWEDDAGYKALKRAAKLLWDHRDLPIVTWNGLADLERVAGAAEAWAAVGEKIRIDRADVARRHIDMLKVVRGSIALAIPSLRLKEVAQRLGVSVVPPRTRWERAISEGGPIELTIADGRDAQEAISFLRDWSKPSANDLAVRRAVEEYLRQDLRLTAEVTRHVVGILGADLARR